MKIVKVLRIVSEHKQKKSRGQVEAIVLTDADEIVTVHRHPRDLPKIKGAE